MRMQNITPGRIVKGYYKFEAMMKCETKENG